MIDSEFALAALAQREEEVVAALAERTGRERYLIDQSQALAAVYGSTSWRMTAPLRCISTRPRRLRKILGRVPRVGGRVRAPPAPPPVLQVRVLTLRHDWRRCLYTAERAVRVMGLPEAESDELLEGLMAHATQREFVYSHRWRLNDLVMWDNTGTMHRAEPYDSTCGRLMLRTKLEGDEPFA